MSFEKNVFINCPFDAEYRPLLRAIIFTIYYFDLEPRYSITISSGHIRIHEIMKLIEESLYSIHDLSRCRLSKGADEEIARFNMPYELGLDIGCSRFGEKKYEDKKCLIMEEEPNLYDRSISDISGQDIKTHSGKAEIAMEKVREWFVAIFRAKMPSSVKMWNNFTELMADATEEIMKEENVDYDTAKKMIDGFSTDDFAIIAKEWIAKKKATA